MILGLSRWITSASCAAELPELGETAFDEMALAIEVVERPLFKYRRQLT